MSARNTNDPPRSGSSSQISKSSNSEPSYRKISNKRVNTESSSLLRSQASNEYSSVESRTDVTYGNPAQQTRLNHGGSPLKTVSNIRHGTQDDQASIIINPRELSHVPSINVLADANGDNTDGTPPTEYEPTRTRTIDNLPWNVVLPYYLPILSWVPEYNISYFLGDLVGGISLATFQIPLCISYATSLAHVPITCGLFSLGIAPLIYMVFGSVPQMVVGPEAPISLIVGQAVEPLLHHAKKKNLDPIEYVVAITLVSGASLLGFGLGRFGFLDNVLSESLLKGFISGVGIVMIINASISMLGLDELLKQVRGDPELPDIHSPFDKLTFLVHYFKQFHKLTLIISLVGFIVIMALRSFKKQATKSQNHLYQKLIYIPEILIVTCLATWLSQVNRWDQKGIDIIGEIKNRDDSFTFYNPFLHNVVKYIKFLSSSGFLCAMLGFFESTTASKSLGSIYNLPISSNRELVALGFINVTGSVFGALPAFGGYGRSKINAISAKTTTSGAIMGAIALVTANSICDYLYFVPKCILSVITCVIGISLIDEAPYELWFHWKSRGYNELVTFAITVLTTVFFSMETGIAVGLIYLLIRVIKHSAESRIQILGRYPGTNTFLDADLSRNSRSIAQGRNSPNLEKNRRSQYNVFTDDNFRELNVQALEEIEGCLIIKIPEPLSFVNTNDLKTRLKRVEMYGSTRAHPALKRSRDSSMTKYIIFDLDGMTELDSSAAQILLKLLQNYEERGIRSFFVRVIEDRHLKQRLNATGIAKLLTRHLELMKYFDYQASSPNRRLNRFDAGETASLQGDDIDTADDTSSLDRLIGEYEEPYFSHISDALKIIDHYEGLNKDDESLIERDSEFGDHSMV